MEKTQLHTALQIFLTTLKHREDLKADGVWTTTDQYAYDQFMANQANLDRREWPVTPTCLEDLPPNVVKHTEWAGAVGEETKEEDTTSVVKTNITETIVASEAVAELSVEKVEASTEAEEETIEEVVEEIFDEEEGSEEDQEEPKDE